MEPFHQSLQQKIECSYEFDDDSLQRYNVINSDSMLQTILSDVV